jgi:hypothetical protein
MNMWIGFYPFCEVVDNDKDKPMSLLEFFRILYFKNLSYPFAWKPITFAFILLFFFFILILIFVKLKL